MKTNNSCCCKIRIDCKALSPSEVAAGALSNSSRHLVYVLASEPNTSSFTRGSTCSGSNCECL